MLNGLDYSLCVHDKNYSSQDLLLNSDQFAEGELVLVKLKGDRLVLRVSKHTDLKTQQISLSQQIASQFDLQPRSLIAVKKVVDLEKVCASRIEISFRDQYIGRKSGGLVTENTRFIFRSETAKFFIFVQMSKEMWEFDEDGEIMFEKCVNGFLPELFQRWKTVGTSHVVSIVMFSRVYYQDPSDFNQVQSDGKGKFYKDFYNVIIDWESHADWAAVLASLKKEFSRYRQNILQLKDKDGNVILSGTNSSAVDGNLLEAVNLALNPFDKHFIDRDLTRTGLSIVVVTPGTGVYNVDKKLCRLTTQRMIDNGVSLDLVCLSKPPLHVVPALCFNSKTNSVDSPPDLEYNSGSLQGRDKTPFSAISSDTRKVECYDHLYMDDTIISAGNSQKVYLVPDWVDCSFWDRNSESPVENSTGFKPTGKMYDIQMMGLMDSEPIISIPHLELFNAGEDDIELLCNAYDDLLFEKPAQIVSTKQKTKLDTFHGSESNLKQYFSKSPSHEDTLELFSSKLKSARLASSVPKYSSMLNPWNRDGGDHSLSALLKKKNSDSQEPELAKKATLKNSASTKDFSKIRESGEAIRKNPYSFSHYGKTKDEMLSPEPHRSSVAPIKIVRQNTYMQRDNFGLKSKNRQSENYSDEVYGDQIKLPRNSPNDYPDAKSNASSDSRGPSPVPEYLKGHVTKFSPSKTPVKNLYLRHNYVNPFSPNDVSRVGINDHRWEHIPKWISHEGSQLFTNWDSLCRPACLPLTIEYFPSAEELSEYYQEYTYTVSPALDEFSSGTEKSKIEALLVELISQRLAQGFQLIVPPASESISGLSKPLDPSAQQKNQSLISISKPYFLFLGDHVHKLFYDSSGKNVEVKRYTRRKNYNTDQISYRCSIWSVKMPEYQPVELSFTYPALSTYNWNYLDHLICGYQDQMTDALRFWRIRLLLLPLESAPQTSTNFNERLDEEEERVEGFLKFMDMIEKSRYLTPSEQESDRRKLDIQLTTLNLSSLVKNENVHSLLPEAFAAPERVNQKKPEKQLSKSSTKDAIAAVMFRAPPEGLIFQDRLWHSEIFEHIATGDEIVDWILTHFIDCKTRQEAIEIGNSLIMGEILEHVKYKQKLLDGFYFYKPCTAWLSMLKTMPNSDLGPRNQRFHAVKQISLDLDPGKKSSRQEIAQLHYDTTHNVKNGYHFQLHWLVCTARLVEDMLHQWMRMAEKTGFRLVEVPGRQASACKEEHPFQPLRPIKLSVPPPSTTSIDPVLRLAPDYFYRELLMSIGYILDAESDSLFPPSSRVYSYQRKAWPNTQFIHNTGVACVEILPEQSMFLWVKNRLLLVNQASVKHYSMNHPTMSLPEQLFEQLQSFCEDLEGLTQFWDKTVVKLKEIAKLGPKNGIVE